MRPRHPLEFVWRLHEGSRLLQVRKNIALKILHHALSNSSKYERFFSGLLLAKKNPLIYGCSLLAFRAPILHSSARRKLIAILLQLSKLNASFKLSGLESPIVTLFKVKTFNSFPTLHLSDTSFTFSWFFFYFF